MDPLSVLRDYSVRGDMDKVKLVDDEYHFGEDYKFPKGVETAYRSKQGGFYTLDALVFFVQNAHVKHTDYMNAARNVKLQFATFTDRKPLQDYLEGRVVTTDAIEFLLPPPAGLTAAAAAAAAALTTPSGTDITERGSASTKHGRYDDDDVQGEGNYHVKKRLRAVEAQEATDCGSTSVISLIRQREWPVRDRDSILLCHNKSFGGVLAALLGRRGEDSDRKKSNVEIRKDAVKLIDHLNPVITRYANVEEKRFWKEHVGTDVAEEFGINPSQSYISDSKKKDEGRMNGPVDPKRPSQHPHHRLKSKPDGPPIIIVPSASQTLLNTFNVKEFLEDGAYVAPEVKVKALAKKVDIVFVQRKMGRERPVPYEVRDKIAGLTSKDWERVVAVFVLGKDWQFKGWPFSDRVEIFNKFMGVFLRFEDDSVESAKQAMQWNVKIINLSKHKRHQDKTAVLNFWQGLDSYIQSRKLNLLY